MGLMNETGSASEAMLMLRGLLGAAIMATLMLLIPARAQAVTYANVSVPFSWVDASSHTKIGYGTSPYKFNNTGGCGTTPPTLDDTLSDNIPIGFTFSYGGVGFTQVRVMSNGRLQFNNNTTCSYGSPVTQLPYPNSGLNYTMRIYGNDLDPTLKSEVPGYSTVCTSRASCYVSYATVGTAPNRSFVVTWSNVPEWTSTTTASGSYNLQVILQENGEFIYQYGTDVPGPGNVNAQIGWQLSTTDYAIYAVGFPVNNSAIKFYIPSPVAEFRMDESGWSGAGSVVNSTTGGTNGAPTGTAQTVAGGHLCRGGNIPSNNLAATIDAVDTGYDVDSQIGSSGAVTFWYKSNSAWSGGGSQDSQLLDATVANNRWFYLVKQSDNGRLSFNLTDNANSNFQVTTGNNTFAANAWVHVGITWNLTPVAANNRLRIYINGALAKTSAISTTQPLSTTIGTLYAGDNRSSFTTNPGTVKSANGVIDELNIYNSELTAAVILRDYNASRTCPALNHARIDHAGSGVTCVGSSVTVSACNGADSGDSCTANSDGLSGNVVAKSAGGATLATVPFVIASGSSSATVTVPVTTAQTVTLETSGLSVVPANASTCWDGSTPSCSHVYSDAGFIFSSAANGAAVTIPAQVAGTSSNTYYLRAVKTSTTSKACEAALTSPTTVNFAYECNNPATCSSSNLMSLNGGAATTIPRNNNGSVSSYSSVSMAFDGNGNAPFTFNFGDVGAVTLHANKEAGGSLLTALAGSTNSFVVAPASFAFSGITAGPIKAGNNFSATVTARTSSGVATPNFGKEATPETVTLSFARYQPTGAGAVDGIFTGSVGSFSGGAATSSNLNWSEVGMLDLVATLASGSYLSSGLTASGTTGTTGAVGRFIPDHFDVAVTQGCSTGSFTYSGQPFTVTVTAKNAFATTTQNYDGTSDTTPNFAKPVTLSDANAVAGSLSPASVAASAFAVGVANATPAFTFTVTPTAPATIKLRAVDTDGVTSAAAIEGTATIRSGRLQLANVFGSEKSSLKIPVRAQYWGGNSWVLNASDSCTTIPATSVALSNYRDRTGSAGAWTTTASGPGILSGGQGLITLSPPSPANSTGSVDAALNLGTTATDSSCLASHPAMAAPAISLAYLRGKNGHCAASVTNSADPSATVSFGIYSPESRKAVHVRELY